MQLPKENQDYEFIPVKNDEWQIRFLTGPYPETVISYGKVTAFENESSDDATLKFDFTVHSSPDNQLTDKDAGLQNYAGDVLVSILESSIDNKEVIITPSEDK